MKLPLSAISVLLLLLCLLPLSLGQGRLAEDSGGAEYSVVQQSSLTSEYSVVQQSSLTSQQRQFCLPESVVFRRQGVDYCFTEQQWQGALYTRIGWEVIYYII